MSAADYSGGPAYPEPGLSGLPNGEFIHPRAGMTLRDAIFLAIVQGELAAQDARHEGKGTGVFTLHEAEAQFRRCWKMADAAIATRPADNQQTEPL